MLDKAFRFSTLVDEQKRRKELQGSFLPKLRTLTKMMRAYLKDYCMKKVHIPNRLQLEDAYQGQNVVVLTKYCKEDVFS